MILIVENYVRYCIVQISTFVTLTVQLFTDLKHKLLIGSFKIMLDLFLIIRFICGLSSLCDDKDGS